MRAGAWAGALVPPTEQAPVVVLAQALVPGIESEQKWGRHTPELIQPCHFDPRMFNLWTLDLTSILTRILTFLRLAAVFITPASAPLKAVIDVYM